LVGLMVFLSFAPYLSPAKAQTTWYNQSFQEWYGKVYDQSNPSEIFGERYTAAQVQWIVYGLFSFMVNSVTGPQNTGLIQCFISNVANVTTCVDQLKTLITSNPIPATMAKTNQKQQSLLSLIFATDRPISGIAYVKEKLQKFSLVPVAHAQTIGFGFNALEPVKGMWTAVRNISFGLFVIVAIVFAFMIMFRVKLSPQTVISVQSALPKIIFALILVTFSYAIAGFLIDLMYVVIGLMSVMITTILHSNGPSTATAIGEFNFMTTGSALGGIQLGIIGAGLEYLILFVLFALVLLSMTFVGLASIVGMTLLSLTGIGTLILIILLAIIVVILLVMFFKTLWALLKAFANVLLLTILAPLQITLGVLIPSLSFGKWLKSYVSNLAVFVVTGTLMNFSLVFLFIGITQGLGSDLVHTILSLLGFLPGAIYDVFVPKGAWPPLLGSQNGPGLGLLFLAVSFVIFTMIPKANELIQSILSGKPFAYGTAIGEVGAVAGGAAYYMGSRVAKGQGPIPYITPTPSATAKGYAGTIMDRVNAMRSYLKGH